MGSLSFALVALIVAQLSTCLPQVNTPTRIAITNSAPAPTFTCGGCYVVADVAGIQFGTETITQLQSATLSVGFNLTTIISVQTEVGVTEFSFGTTGLLGSATGALFNYGTAITYSGVTLTSPTAYDVFTAYSITSTISTDGTCSTVFGTPIPVSPAFSFVRPEGAAGIDESAEQAFINSIGLPTCQPGGVNISPTSVVPVIIQTSFSTITRALPTPQPLMSATSITPSSTTTTTTAATSSTPTSTSSLSSSTATTTLTSTISVVAIIPEPLNTTTLTSTISVGTIIVVGNSTFLPTGFGPTYTIVPVKNQAANWRTDSTISWLAWATGALSTLVAVWAF